MTAFLDQASCWFLHSGIQERSGGVARYYRADRAQNAPVSAEITGYVVSTLFYLHTLAGRSAELDGALRAARYLAREAWDSSASTFPFEPGSSRAYFFDIGIIIRGLLSAWRATGEEEFRTRAHEAALSLAFDFLGDGVFHPIISLPDKQPVPYDQRWSRTPGCYQLKSALAWRDLGDEHAAPLFDSVLAYSLSTHDSFLRGEPDHEKLMDRLHAYCYFLEALLAVADREEPRRVLVQGIDRVAAMRREIAPRFERSDVCAQLLRLRLIAHHLYALPLDENAASEEAHRTASYQADSPDPRLRGAFWFGMRSGEMLRFANPVSAAFGVQALVLWRQHQARDWRFDLSQLI